MDITSYLLLRCNKGFKDILSAGRASGEEFQL